MYRLHRRKEHSKEKVGYLTFMGNASPLQFWLIKFRMNRSSLLLLCILCVIYTGCRAANLENQTPVESMPSAIYSSTPTTEITKTATPQKSTPSPTILPTVSPTATLDKQSLARVTEISLEILPELPENVTYSGKVILEGRVIPGVGYSGVDSRLDMETGELVPIPQTEGITKGGYIASPDRTLLAYWKGYLTADKLHYSGISIAVEDASGNAVAELPGEIDEWDAFYWLDNERLAIGLYGQPRIYDLLSNENITPDWFVGSPGGLHMVPLWEVNAIFDAKLTRLLYIQEDSSLILMEVESKRVLRKIDSETYDYFPPPLARPKWSWDDEQVVFALDLTDDSRDNDEFFTLDREGNLTQLTNLGAYYSEYSIGKFSWPPDGQKVGFYFRDYSDAEGALAVVQFAILDLPTLGITNYGALGGWIYWTEDPIWSVDGQQVLIERNQEPDAAAYATILLDLKSGFAAKLVDNLLPAGWMKTP